MPSDESSLPSPPDEMSEIALLYRRAAQVLGDAETARDWMHAPQFGLAQATPLSLLATGTGRQQVRALLDRIEHGHVA